MGSANDAVQAPAVSRVAPAPVVHAAPVPAIKNRKPVPLVMYVEPAPLCAPPQCQWRGGGDFMSGLMDSCLEC